MLGSFVRRIRRSRGMSQRDLAAVSGVSQPNISAIENDRRKPSADTLGRLLLSCGYELAAVAGERVLFAPLSGEGFFPDDDLPPRVLSDPSDEAPTVDARTPMEVRARVLGAALEVAESQ